MISHSILLVRTKTAKKTLENWRTAKTSNNLKKIFWDMKMSVQKNQVRLSCLPWLKFPLKNNYHDLSPFKFDSKDEEIH